MNKLVFQPFLIDIQPIGYIVIPPDRYKHFLVDVVSALFLSRVNNFQLSNIDEHMLRERISDFCDEVNSHIGID